MNDGASYKKVPNGSNDNWSIATTFTITTPTNSDILIFVCQDKGVVGGFIGNVEYNQHNYYTKNQLQIVNLPLLLLIHQNYIVSIFNFFLIFTTK